MSTAKLSGFSNNISLKEDSIDNLHFYFEKYIKMKDYWTRNTEFAQHDWYDMGRHERIWHDYDRD